MRFLISGTKGFRKTDFAPGPKIMPRPGHVKEQQDLPNQDYQDTDDYDHPCPEPLVHPVSCGSHNAACCSRCTDGHQDDDDKAIRCNGDCVWHRGRCRLFYDYEGNVVLRPGQRHSNRVSSGGDTADSTDNDSNGP